MIAALARGVLLFCVWAGYARGMNRTHLPLCMIAALGENRVIGVDNQLPWHLSEDLQHFKRMTLGKPVIMGRKTWDSIGRPLPGRLNIVISRQTDLQLSGAEVFADLPAALRRARDWAKLEDAEEIMLIGGAQLYREALPLAERLYLTHVALAPEGDAFFPELDNHWHCTSSVEHPAREDKPAFAFQTWQRVGAN